VSGFGSDQFDETDHGEKAQMMKFFNWFFFFISLGSLLAVTVLVYIQDNLGREWGYGLCATAIALGLVVFLSGTWRYRFKKLVGSPLTQIAVVVAAAWRKRGLELPSDPSLLHDIDERQAATDAEKGSKRSNAKQRVPHTKQFRYALNSSLLSCCRHLVPTFPLIMVSRVVSCCPHISIRIMNLSFPALLVLLRTHMKKKKKKKRGGMDSGNISQDPGHGLTLLCVGAFRCHAFGKQAAGWGSLAEQDRLVDGQSVLVMLHRKDKTSRHFTLGLGRVEAISERGRESATRIRFLDRAAIDVDLGATQGKRRLPTLTDVEEVKIVIRMLPIWATTIMFWTVYAQMTTFSVSQATTMDRRIGPSFRIPPGSLTVFFVGSILLTVPVYDRVVVPVSRRLTGNPHGLTPLQRIGAGLMLSILAMSAAALTEIKRLRVARSTPAALENGATVPMSVFWLIPQFFLVGAGEAFTYIGQLDFFLRECPKGMKTMSTGLFLSTLSLGFFVSSALVTVVHKVTGERGHGAWLADNLNRGKLYNFYWLLAVLCLVNLVAYLVAARWYTYKEQRKADDDDSMAVVELTEEAACCHA
ncbi:hypothetical protein GW17_00026691, partial [Ensete ventricosum]